MTFKERVFCVQFHLLTSWHRSILFN